MGTNTEPSTDERFEATPIAHVAFDLLKDTRRRHALYHLHETNGPVKLTALAEHVATAVTDSSDCVSAEEIDAVRTSLHHSQLPRMQDAGIVTYNPDESTVVTTRWPEAFESFLSATAEYESGR